MPEAEVASRAGRPPAGSAVPAIDVAQECFVVARLADLARWARAPETAVALWRGLAATVQLDRGLEGIRWAASGALAGSAEVWLEPYGDGVIVHCYLRAERPGGRLREAAVLRRKRAWQRHLARELWRLKDGAEGGRELGIGRGFGTTAVKPPTADAET